MILSAACMRVKRFFTTHQIQKAIAIILTVFAWFAVQMVTDTTTTINNIPIHFIPPTNTVILSPIAHKVSIQVRGREHVLQELNPNLIKVEIQLPELPPSPNMTHHQQIKLLPTDVKVPSGCVVVSLSPDLITIETDKLIKRKKPISITTTGSVSNEYEIALSSIPTMVGIEGPSTIVNSIFSIKTVPIQLESAMTESFSILACDLASPPNHIQYNQSKVDISAIVMRKKIHRFFESYGVNYLITPDFPYNIELAEELPIIQVAVTGGLNVVRSINQVECYVDFSNIKQIPDDGVVTLPIMMIEHDELSCLGIKPNSLKFKLTPKK